jgi:hypothetical protein
MKRGILALAVAITAVVLAGPAAANLPKGNGLELLEAPIALTCTGDQRTFGVTVTPGGGATGWRVDVNGQTVNQHHVLSYFSITVGGTTTYQKTWGVKSGLASLDCSQTIFDTVIVGTIHPLPGNDN